MKATLDHIGIAVANLEEALAFYRDALGFTVISDVANGGFRWVSLAGSDGTGTSLVLSAPGAGRSDADAQTLAELVAKGTIGPLVLSTTDLDQVFETVSASGAEVLQEPMDQPWGPRDCAFRDPSGNMVRINQSA